MEEPKPGGKLRQSRIALVIGTRPEAIKLSPVAHALAALGERPRLLVTGQHPGLELADHRLAEFDATPLHCAGQPDPMVHAELVRGALKRLLPMAPPELIVVQGDTSSALGGALAARDVGIGLAHVEAGLRSHDPAQPWPEEENRVAIDRISDLLLAPTDQNATNLRREKLGGDIEVTGNSGIDALAEIVGRLPVKRRRKWLRRRSLRLLVTCHRRENWGRGLDQLASALIELAGNDIASEVVLPFAVRTSPMKLNASGGSLAINASRSPGASWRTTGVTDAITVSPLTSCTSNESVAAGTNRETVRRAPRPSDTLWMKRSAMAKRLSCATMLPSMGSPAFTNVTRSGIHACSLM